MNEMNVFEWLASSALASYVRQSHLLYPVIETIHIIGFVILAGGAFLFDLRLLGVSKHQPVSDIARHVLPWSRRSLVLVIPSGVILFMTDAPSLVENRVFLTKLVLIALALTNAGIFHRYTFKGVSGWNQHIASPPPARAAGIISIVLWTGVITCGRFLAYLE
jgi:hypothetical protein